MAYRPGSSFLFISDVHLGAFSEKKNQSLEDDLIAIVDYCESHRIQPIILGDFFDYWMEYPLKKPPLGYRIVKRFTCFHESTKQKTLFITGNHDNWIRDDGFLQQAGFDLESEYRLLDVNKTTFFLFHGDGFKNRKMSLLRPFIHRILRNPYFVKVFQFLLPPEAGWKAMKLFSRTSKTLSKKQIPATTKHRVYKWINRYSKQNKNISAFVFGHIHTAKLEEKDQVVILNCGCFGKDRTGGLYTNGNFKLVKWNSEIQDLSVIANISHE